MISALADFFNNRFVQRRYSSTVSGSAPYVHTAAPVWAHTLSVPPSGVTRVLPNGTQEVCQVVPGYTCEADILAPSDTRAWWVPFPFLGAMHWEEAVMAINNMQPDSVALIALTDAFFEIPTMSQRAELSFDCLLVYPAPGNQTANWQSHQVGDIVGHLREAAANANAQLRGVVELAHLGDRVTNEHELPSELYGIRFRLFVREIVNRYKSNSYGLQM